MIHYRTIGRKPLPREKRADSRGAKQLLNQWDHIIEKKGVLYRINHCHQHLQLILPDSIRGEFLNRVHDHCGNQGLERKEQLVSERCWLPGLQNYVKRYLSECERCIVAKGPYLPVKTMMTSIIASSPWKYWPWTSPNLSLHQMAEKMSWYLLMYSPSSPLQYPPETSEQACCQSLSS